jgi:hypothetical protein
VSFLFALLLTAGTASAQDLCSDYLSKRNCINRSREIRAVHEDKDGPVFLCYAHVEGYAHVVPGLKLKPGDPIGTTIPLRPLTGETEGPQLSARGTV